MPDEIFSASLNLIFKAPIQPRIIAMILKQLAIKVWMWTISVAQMIGELCADGNFNPFNRVHHEEAKFSIKDIEIENLLKTYICLELVGFMVGFERQPIGSKPIVI